MSFQRTTQVKRTRKACHCRWCDELINQGEPSTVVTGTFEGDFFCLRYHPECDEAIKRYCRFYHAWGEELPDGKMNRGGIMPYGDPEPTPSPEPEENQ